MKRLIGLILAASLIVTVIPLPGSAATTDAASFAADCNDDGRVRVLRDRRLRVIGGVGELTGNCFVRLQRGATLVFKDAELTDSCVGPVCGLIVGNSERNTTIKVLGGTSIDLSGDIQLAAGCCSGGEDPEQNGFVKVKNSSVSGRSVQIASSVSVPGGGGTTIVLNSSIEASAFGIFVTSSDGGYTKFNDNTVASPSNLEVKSGLGSAGRVNMKRNDLTGVSGTVTASAVEGPCNSPGNTPAVVCS